MIILFSLTAWFFNLHHYLNFEMLKKHQKILDLFTKEHQLISVLTYFGLYILVVSFSIPGAAFMTVSGGFLFGQIIGTSTTVVAATIGASLLFLSTKIASQDIEKKWVQKMQEGFQKNAFSYLLTLRLIPIFPFVAINLAAALLQIPFRTFFFGTLFGIIPGSFVYISLGVALREVIQKPNFAPDLILDPKILLAFIGLGLLSLLPVFYKKFQKNHSN